jgi:hypothetical protein
MLWSSRPDLDNGQRGIPTEEVLKDMRESEIPVCYLVGTPRGLLSRYEAELSNKLWKKVKEDVKVKILPKDKERYILAESRYRKKKEKQSATEN